MTLALGPEATTGGKESRSAPRSWQANDIFASRSASVIPEQQFEVFDPKRPTIRVETSEQNVKTRVEASKSEWKRQNKTHVETSEQNVKRRVETSKRNSKVRKPKCELRPPHQKRPAFHSNDVYIHSKPGPKLGNMLCSANKTHPNKFDLKGVYLQTCTCSNAKYVGQTRVNFRTRMGQHLADVTSSKSDETISGISKHAKTS